MSLSVHVVEEILSFEVLYEEHNILFCQLDVH